jgi:hypothetical protein
MPYDARLSDGVKLPEGHRIDTADPRYKALEELATRERWSQAAFTSVLDIEARRVSSEHERTRARSAAAPAPAPAPKPEFSKMSTQQQFHHAIANSPGRRPLP